MHVESFLDERTATFTHLVVDQSTKKCAIIDSVLDFEARSGRFYTENADRVVNYIKENNLTNEWILETHIHADHITGAFYLKKLVGGKTAIHANIKEVLALWVPIFDLTDEIPLSGDQFDLLYEEGDTIDIGVLKLTVMHTPGHTPACSTFVGKKCAFIGDTLFSPKSGTARCDFPGGGAEALYKSIQKIYALPDETVLYLCHDYPKDGSAPRGHTTVAEQKMHNIMLDGKTEINAFVNKRTTRDKSLKPPKLLFPSIQTNMRIGEFGKKSDVSGFSYIKIPIGMFDRK